ncbi:oxidoreductase [candidate division WWE3 bacterium RIFOXYD1_FULL_39_9]|uniref:Oxidoreductase n=1 Tax=candidate division WWE3 bacterium RIFOXYD1_FULL_39_9 TaxID=1802649 RepID=A0A1F4X565_UNCKA|nr:MAG: oxidoreductase [candidate division WWE3 bacterium RIFOXYD1_FULL_39_9]
MRLSYLLLLVIILGCTSRVTSQLDGVEIRDYMGEDLSSVNDFRENSIRGVQYVDISDYALNVNGLLLSYDNVLSLDRYSKVVTLYCVEGWSVKLLWEGVLVKDLLNMINGSGNTVIFRALDGYSSSLPYDYIISNNILLAFKMNNVTLPPERGYPFQLVAEDRLGYKWVKWVTSIELSNNSGFLGYWESRGYENEAVIGK